ncbi:MAG TPA: TolC family protein [Rickettsiales bacterium]|nr:TolC family protein [Rickettsiales bacterium]
MNKKKIKIFTIIFCFLLNFNANAEEIKYQKTRVLTLIDILEMALENNPKVKEAWLNIDVSKYSYRTEFSDYFPDITGEIDYSKTKSDYKNNTADARSEYVYPSINLSYLLFDFGGRESSINSFKYKLEATKFETNDYVQSFMYSVIEAYYNLFSSIASERAAKETESSSYEAFKAAKMRYKIGLAPLTDKLQAETSYMQEKLAREKAENEVKIKKAELNYLLNLTPTTELNLSAPLLSIPNKDFTESIENLLERAVKNRPDLKAYYETKKAKKSEIYNAKSEWLPSISLTSSYGRINDMERNSHTDRDTYNVGVTATMPFFTGGSIYNNVAKTKSELKIIDTQINDLEKSIELDVWTAYQNFLTAKKTYITSESLLKSARETEKTMFGKYKNGKSSILDLLDAQSDLASARYEFISAQHNWFITRANLVKVLGEMSVEELSYLSTVTSSNNNRKK